MRLNEVTVDSLPNKTESFAKPNLKKIAGQKANKMIKL